MVKVESETAMFHNLAGISSAYQVFDEKSPHKARLKSKTKRKLSLSPKTWMFKFKDKNQQRQYSCSRATFGYKWKEHNSWYWRRIRQTPLSRLLCISQTNAEKVLEALKEIQSQQATVMRDGTKVFSLPATELVPGDIVELRVGDTVPAAMRVLVLISSTLRVEQGSLTGESEAVSNTTRPVAECKTTNNISFTHHKSQERFAILIKQRDDEASTNIIDNATRSSGNRATSLLIEMGFCPTLVQQAIDENGEALELLLAILTKITVTEEPSFLGLLEPKPELDIESESDSRRVTLLSLKFPENLVDWLMDFTGYDGIVDGIRCLATRVCSGIQHPIDSRRASRVWERGGLEIRTDHGGFLVFPWHLMLLEFFLFFYFGRQAVLDQITKGLDMTKKMKVLKSWMFKYKPATSSSMLPLYVNQMGASDIQDNDKQMVADPVKQAVLNLITNAARFGLVSVLIWLTVWRVLYLLGTLFWSTSFKKEKFGKNWWYKFKHSMWQREWGRELLGVEILVPETVVDVRFVDVGRRELLLMFSKVLVHLYPSFKLEDKLGLQGVSIDTFHHSHYRKNKKEKSQRVQMKGKTLLQREALPFWIIEARGTL